MSDLVQPTDERAAQAAAVIALVGEGMLLREACAAHSITPQAFGRVLARLRNLAELYARAQEVAADLMIDDTIRIAGDKTLEPAQARNMMQARQWAASKRAPKTYGDRVDISVTQNISAADARTEAWSRVLRPVSDQSSTPLAQDVDFIEVLPSAPSAAASPDDIFS